MLFSLYALGFYHHSFADFFYCVIWDERISQDLAVVVIDKIAAKRICKHEQANNCERYDPFEFVAVFHGDNYFAGLAVIIQVTRHEEVAVSH